MCGGKLQGDELGAMIPAMSCSFICAKKASFSTLGYDSCFLSNRLLCRIVHIYLLVDF